MSACFPLTDTQSFLYYLKKYDMKQVLLIMLCISSAALSAQVTQINSNRSLTFASPLNSTKSIFFSATDSTVWASDGTLAGTIQLSPDILFNSDIGVLNGKFIFGGRTAATGRELFITDGTPAGTGLLADIEPGVPGSDPQPGGAILNGYIYFSATTLAAGKELWKSNGTGAGTEILKDIVPGPGSSNVAGPTGNYHIVSTGTFLLFQAEEVGLGVELWKSDGTTAGTALLKDINAGPAGSLPQAFTALNSTTILFSATTLANGREAWKTDGTGPGTVLLKDINPLGSGFSSFFGEYFFIFNGKAYFNANDGVNGEEMWWTDGTEANTLLFKDLTPGPLGSTNLIIDAVVYGNKFFFPSSVDLFVIPPPTPRFEIIESDGTPAGTQTFKDFTAGGELPVLFPSYDYTGQTFTQRLFQGDKFFFMAATVAEGRELWISNGTLAGTQMVRDINPGSDSSIRGRNVSYLYTTTDFFFPADNGVNGIELWRTNGTLAGTTMVADIVANAPGSDQIDISPLLINSRVVFEADNKDNASETDLYAVNGTFDPIVVPVKLLDFTVMPKAGDAALQWHITQQLNCREYTIQRSEDGKNFINIGTVPAISTTGNILAYSYRDAGIIATGKPIIYYRLLITDIDGKTASSNIILLRLDKTSGWDVRLLSNPVAENLQLILSGARQEVQLTLLDASGKITYYASLDPVSGQLSVPMASFAKGIYILVVQVGNDKKSIRFVK
jgi:ELWxxDGT repeat protein